MAQTSTSLLRLRCNQCQWPVAAETALAGEVVSCPNCRRKILIPSPHLEMGSRIDAWVVQRWLGGGGMGEVHEVLHPDGRRGAMKIILPQRLSEKEVQHFRTECSLLLQLHHPHLVRAYEAGISDGTPYLVTEFISAPTLEELLRKVARLDEARALAIILAIARAMHYAHSQLKLIHRDIKPGNILYGDDGVARLMDLGIALPQDLVSIENKAAGTSNYMSPEQISHPGQVDHRSDIYGLGATLYELVSGIEAYPGHERKAVQAAILAGPPRPLGHVLPGISSHTQAAVARLMAPQVQDRPATWPAAISLLEETLRKVLAGTPPAPDPACAYRPLEDWRAHTPLFMGAAAIVAAAIVAAALLIHGR